MYKRYLSAEQREVNNSNRSWRSIDSDSKTDYSAASREVASGEDSLIQRILQNRSRKAAPPSASSSSADVSKQQLTSETTKPSKHMSATNYSSRLDDGRIANMLPPNTNSGGTTLHEHDQRYSNASLVNDRFDDIYRRADRKSDIFVATTTSKYSESANSANHITTESMTNFSVTNSILDIFNDENTFNSLVVNDTLLTDLNNDAVSSSNSNTSIDSLFNVSYNAGFVVNTNSSSVSNVRTFMNGSLSSSILSTTSSILPIDEAYTPTVSQVLLAPTITALTHYPISTDSTYVALGSIANGASVSHHDAGQVYIGGGSSEVDVNATQQGIDSFYFYKAEQLTFLSILFIVIVLGNTAVLLTLFLNKNRKSRMNFFIKQLAIADLCVGLINVLTDIIWRLTISWRAGNIPCKIIRYSECCITYASTYVLVALSIDRYDAITHPMNFSGSWQRARRLVILAWTISAIFSIPILFLYEETLIEKELQCWIDLKLAWRWKLYMSLISITLFIIPTVIISACYAVIIRTIWVKGSVFVPAERPGRNSTCMASRRASSRGIIPRAKVKTVKMTFVIVIVFIMCWSPYIVFNLYEVFAQPPKTQKNIAISTFIQSLAPLNSAANPLIYCLFSTQVCRALKRIPPFRWFDCLSCCDKQGGNNSAHNRCTTVNQRLHNSYDSMRTLTTSLNVSRRSNNCMRPARVVIVERPKTILAMSEV